MPEHSKAALCRSLRGDRLLPPRSSIPTPCCQLQVVRPGPRQRNFPSAYASPRRLKCNIKQLSAPVCSPAAAVVATRQLPPVARLGGGPNREANLTMPRAVGVLAGKTRRQAASTLIVAEPENRYSTLRRCLAVLPSAGCRRCCSSPPSWLSASRSNDRY